MMKLMSKQFVMLGVLALNIGVGAVASEAAVRKCTSEECACEAALRKNTIEALEAFLKKYPHSVDSGKTACAALAIPSSDEGIGASSEATEEGVVPLSGGISSGG